MRKIKVFVFLKNKKKPFVFKMKFNEFINLLEIIDEARESEIVNVENVYFAKNEFSYSFFKKN